jgi:hypothetical protein
MDEEIASLLENGTWTVEKPPAGVKPVPMRWTYKLKRDKQVQIERYKARFVAKGFKLNTGLTTKKSLHLSADFSRSELS